MLALTDTDQGMIEGSHGPAVALAMRITTRMASIQGATSLIDVTMAHIDGCLYHGAAGLDFAQRLVALGGQVRIPTTLNVASLDLLHPELYKGDEVTAASARALMDAYVKMGCRPTWTCAPYGLPDRPGFGEQIAWAESNAIVFANSVLGARTNRYGDFVDICAALTGRVPASGLHTDSGRRAQVHFDVSKVSGPLRRSSAFSPLLGALIGREAGSRVAVVTGIDAASEDDMKAMGAAAAASGAVALIHVVGITPEAPTLEDALQGEPPEKQIVVGHTDLVNVRDELGQAEGTMLDAVSLGTPHASLAELHAVRAELRDRPVAESIACYLSTSRETLSAAETDGTVAALVAAGIQLVTDTCTYITPILDPATSVVMTDSAKWAYYAPGNIGVEPVFGSLGECVESAVAGSVVRDLELWSE